MKRVLLGLLLLLCLAGRVEAASIVRYVNTASSGGDGTTNNTSGADAAFASLSAAEDALDGTAFGAGETCTINCSGTAADTTAVTFAGWDADVTVKIVGDSDGTKYDTSKYRLEVAGDVVQAITITHTKIDFSNLQLKITSNGNAFHRSHGIWVNTSGTATFRLHNSIIIGVAGANDRVRAIEDQSFSTAITYYIYNNIFANFISSGENCEAIHYIKGVRYIENNTFYNCGTGIYTNEGTIVAINNLFASCTTNATGTFAAGTDYNATDDASIGYTVTGGGNSHDHTSHTFTFTSTTPTTTGFMHLASNDAGAIDLGYSSINGGFTVDIDGETRSGTWDIGADEYIAPVGAVITKIILGD